MYIITEEDEKKLAKLGPYQQAILRLLAEVPKGKVTTYGDLANELYRRNPRFKPTARAVGTTMRNKLLKFLPMEFNINNFPARQASNHAKAEVLRYFY